MSKFHVAERFVSINGEARRAGELAVFIRFAGCNLRCNYCDTKWALEKNAPAEIMSEEEIYAYIKETGVKNVTLTGGEPLWQENIERLLRLLGKDRELRIEIETDGAIDIEPFLNIEGNISFTLDYKCPGSGMEKAMLLSNYEKVRKEDTVKFVVSDKADLDKMKEIIERYDLLDKCKVYVSAVFNRIDPVDIVDYMIENKLNDVRLQLQIHKFIWDPDKKGV